MADIAKEIFKEPQTEVGSYTLSNPYDWSFFASYDREQEKRLVEESGSGLERALRVIAVPFEMILGKQPCRGCRDCLAHTRTSHLT